jgi:uncharacterized protein
MVRPVTWIVLMAVALLPWQVGAADDRQALLDQADALEGEGRSAEVLALLRPYAAEDDTEVLARLAGAAFLVATNDGDGAPVTRASIQPAIDYARRTAELGDPIGWNLLWVIHSNGLGVEVDVERAAEYLRAGAEAGDPGALFNLFLQSYGGSPFIDADIEEACAIYDRLVATGLDLPDLIAFTRAEMLIRGHCGLDANPEAGFALWRRLAEDGLVDAQRVVGLALFRGWFSEPDHAGAIEWFKMAAAQGDGPSMWQLGIAYVNGQGVERDDARAVHWFQQGTDVHEPNAVTSLAVMYASGSGVRQDFARAKALYEQAALIGDTHALKNLTVMHVLGQGTPPDPVQAQVYYLQYLHAGHMPDPPLDALLDNALDAAGKAEAQQRFQDWLALQDNLSGQ